MTELFIKKYSDEPTLVNGDFSNGVMGWEIIGTGTFAVENRRLYKSNGDTGLIRQYPLLKTGNYRIEFTISRTNNYLTPTAGGFNVQIGDVSTGWVYDGPGIYKYDYYISDITNQFSIGFTDTFQYAITNIKITLLDGIWNQLDLYDDVEIPLNFQIAEINNIEARRAAYSNTITLPGSKNNNVIFEHLHNLAGVDTFPMSERNECYILDGGLKIFEGYLEVNKININQNNSYTYEVLIYNTIIDLWEKVKDKYLTGNEDPMNDLDFSEHNHVYNSENIVRSFTTPTETPAVAGYTGTATPGSGYTYALIDKQNKYAKDWTTGGHWKIDEISPCLFIKEMWDKIFEKTGYTYTSTFLNSDFFKRLIYPSSNPVIRDTDAIAREFSALNSNVKDPNKVTVDPSIDWPNYSTSYYTKSETYPQAWTNVVNATNFTHNTTTGHMTALKSGYYDVTINLLYDRQLRFSYRSGYPWLPTPDDAVIYTGRHSIISTFETRIVRANGLAFDPALDLLNTEDFIDELPAETTTYGSCMYPQPRGISHYVSQRVFLNVGDSIVTNLRQTILFGWSNGSETFWPFKWDTGGNDHEGWPSLKVELEAYARTAETSVILKADNVITENMIMDLNMILHKDILQSDFMKSIINMFNLYLEQTSPTNYVIEPRDNFYNAYTEIQDLTDKVDFDTYSVERPQMILGTNFKFTYDEDDDTFNSEYKKCTSKIYGEYEKKSSIGSDEKEIKLIFAPTPNGAMTESHMLGFRHFDIPKIFRITGDGQYDIDATFKPRILYWRGWTANDAVLDNWTMFGNNGRQVTISGTYSTVPGTGKFDGKHPYVGHLNAPFGNETLDLNFNGCDWYWSYFPTNVWVTNANLYNKYYTNIINELTNVDARMVTYTAVLSSKDILDIKFYNPICIDGVYYRLYQIEDFVPNKECTLRLLKSLYINDLFVEHTPIPLRPIHINVNANRPINIDVIDIINTGVININTGTINRPVVLPVDIFDPNFGRGYISSLNSYDVIDGNELYNMTGYLYDRNVIFTDKINRNTIKLDLIDPNYSDSLTVDELLNGKKLTVNEKLSK